MCAARFWAGRSRRRLPRSSCRRLWWRGRWALSGPAFPYNYALLMGLAAVFVMISWAALSFYVEPRGETCRTMRRRS